MFVKTLGQKRYTLTREKSKLKKKYMVVKFCLQVGNVYVYLAYTSAQVFPPLSLSL